MTAMRRKLNRVIFPLDLIIVLVSVATLLSWVITGEGLFYNPAEATLSPFTSISILLMTGSRLALKYISTWPTPLTLALLVIVIGGNVSSIMVQWMVPKLILDTFPELVPTSILTSFGIICYAAYEILIIFRRTPKSALILDDILLHLALVPGGLSLLGHVTFNHYYISSQVDPRIGIGFIETFLMGSYAVSATIQNRHLFLWTFLRRKQNQIIFSILFLNQYVLPIFVGLKSAQVATYGLGLDLFVMLAGVLATLLFLSFQAYAVRHPATSAAK